MKKTSNKEIKKALAALKQQNGIGYNSGMANTDEFWSDFKARARLHVQATPEVPRRIPIQAWFLAGACAVALFIVSGIHMMTQDSTSTYNVIKSLEVVASHSAVLIMEDNTKDSTVLWIVDMNTDSSNGDNI